MKISYISFKKNKKKIKNRKAKYIINLNVQTGTTEQLKFPSYEYTQTNTNFKQKKNRQNSV